MRLGIVVGHNKRRQGAVATGPIDEPEFVYNSEIAAIMTDLASDLGLEARVFKRKHRGSTRREIEAVYAETDDWSADVTIELHFNAFNRSVSGTETLCGPSQLSFQTADAVHRRLVELFDRDARGDRRIKTYRPGIRGGASLISGRAPAVLVEPFFGDNTSDATAADRAGKEAIAHAYMSGIAEVWGGRENLMIAGAAPVRDLAHIM